MERGGGRSRRDGIFKSNSGGGDLDQLASGGFPIGVRVYLDVLHAPIPLWTVWM
jgi:hypothetical protein